MALGQEDRVFGSAAEVASTNDKAVPSLALSFELGLGMKNQSL